MHYLPNITQRGTIPPIDNIRSFLPLTYSARKKMYSFESIGKKQFCLLDWANFAGAAANFAASQTIICLAHRPLGSAFHPRRKSVRSPYARERRSRACARAHTREDFSGNARSRRATCSRDHRTPPSIDPSRSTLRELTLPAEKLASRLPTSRDIRLSPAF